MRLPTINGLKSAPVKRTVAPLEGGKYGTTSVNHLADQRTKLSLVHCHPIRGADTMPHGNMHRREHQESCSRANPDGDREQVFINVEITGTPSTPSGNGHGKGRVCPHCQRGGPTGTPVRTPKPRPPSHAPQGYRVMDVPRDGHCLFLACIEAMAHNRVTLLPAWLSCRSVGTSFHSWVCFR